MTVSLGLNEAARAVGVSRRTLERRLKAGTLEATKDTAGAWVIPLVGLLEAGFQLRAVEEPAEEPTPDAPTPLGDERDQLVAELAEARAAIAEQAVRLREAEHRAELAEQAVHALAHVGRARGEPDAARWRQRQHGAGLTRTT